MLFDKRGCLKCRYEFSKLNSTNLEFFVNTRNSVRDKLHNPREYGLSEAVEWLKTLNDNVYLIIMEMDSNVKIGYFRFSIIEHKNLQIGLDISPDNQRKGHGTKLYNCVFEHWNDTINVEKFTLHVLLSNKIALNLYKKLGFKVVNKTKITRNGKEEYSAYMEKINSKFTDQI
jgi:RimJ/RimL family protein N-acetyltransferase